MTVIDDTAAEIAAAQLSIESAISTASADSRFATALDPALGDAASSLSAAQTAVSLYRAALPLPLVAGLSVEGMHSPVAAVKNRICNAYHRDLEPTQGAAIPANNVIDAAIAQGDPFRLRLYFGRYSAAWLIALAGSVTVTDSNDPAHPLTASVPRWWMQKVIDAQTAFIARLAAKYDGKLSLVFLSSPMTVFAEPMQRQTGDPATRTNLVKAGYTLAADRAAFTAAIQMMTAFKRTRPGLAVTPFQYVSASGVGHQDATISNAIMDEFRATFPQGVLQNNSLRNPPLSGEYTTMYDHMTGPLAFQTATESRIGTTADSYAKSIEWAISRKAHLVELSPGFDKHLTAAQLADFDARLRANAA